MDKQQMIEAFKKAYKCNENKDCIFTDEGLLYSKRLKKGDKELSVETYRYSRVEEKRFLFWTFYPETFSESVWIGLRTLGKELKGVDFKLSETELKELSNFIQPLYDKWEQEKAKKYIKQKEEDLKSFMEC